MSVLIAEPSVTLGAVFVRGVNGSLYYMSQSPSGGWPGFVKADSYPLGSSYQFSGPPSASNFDGIPWAAIRGTDGLLYTTGTIPGIVAPLGFPSREAPAIQTDPVTVGNFAFALSEKGEIIVAQNFGDGPAAGVWQGLTPSAKLNGQLGVALNSRNRIELFCLDENSNLWHTWQVDDDNHWAAFFNHGPVLGSTLSNLVLTRDGNGCVQLFANDYVNTSGALEDPTLIKFSQTAPSNGWANASLFVGNPENVPIPSQFAVTNQKNESIVITFVQDISGPLWVFVDQAEPPFGVAAWQNLGNSDVGLQGPPTATLGVTGNVEIFVASSVGDLWHVWQTEPNGSWSNWFNHGQPLN